MNIDDIRKALAKDNDCGPGNPYEVDIEYDEFIKLVWEGNSPYVKCRDCDSIVLREHSVENTEDYVCLWCENER